MDHDINPRWLSLRQACQYASMSENTLLSHIRMGDIYGCKKVGKWYIDRESIDSFFEAEKMLVKTIVASLKEAHV
jgi:predicted site-specific integrase-resolvase